MTTISDQEFADLARLIMDSAGISLDRGKEYLMEARLEPLLERYELATYADLYRQANADQTGKLKATIVDAITINETYFFRDKTPFDLLKNKIIPDLIDLKSKHYSNRQIPIRIWSAACSTGQEVFSIGMTLSELFPQKDRFDIRILGTDISSEAVARASYGKYNQFEVERGLNSYFLSKYFQKVANGWRIKDEIRSMANFQKMDLNRAFTGMGTFDVVFCRNVAIYFPPAGKLKLFQNIAKILNPGGCLIVGGSESLAGIAREFIPRHYLNGIFYQLRDDREPYFPPKQPLPVKKPVPPPQKTVEPSPAPLQKAPPAPVVKEIPPKPVVTAINKRLKAEATEPKKEAAVPEKPATPIAEEKKKPVTTKEELPPKAGQQEPEKQSLLQSLQEKETRGESILRQDRLKKDEGKKSLLELLKEQEEKEG